ncbi:MAG TPA: DinB family protein [Vicinamibacterales bacterium]|nr:DinB family protein [Vicinamibacterales bacterium]
MTVAELNWRPSPSEWSVGQCLEHLFITNEVYLPPMARALDGHAPAPQPAAAITPGWFGRYFIRNYIDPETQRAPKKAPSKIVPSHRVDADILAKFLRSNDAARDLVRRASAYDVNRIRFKNPFVAGIRFTVGTGVEIVWRHQRRHLLQAERVRAVFPS